MIVRAPEGSSSNGRSMSSCGLPTLTRADSSKSMIVDQVANGIYIRMAVLYLLLSSKKGEAA